MKKLTLLLSLILTNLFFSEYAVADFANKLISTSVSIAINRDGRPSEWILNEQNIPYSGSHKVEEIHRIVRNGTYGFTPFYMSPGHHRVDYINEYPGLSEISKNVSIEATVSSKGFGSFQTSNAGVGLGNYKYTPGEGSNSYSIQCDIPTIVFTSKPENMSLLNRTGVVGSFAYNGGPNLAFGDKVTVLCVGNYERAIADVKLYLNPDIVEVNAEVSSKPITVRTVLSLESNIPGADVLGYVSYQTDSALITSGRIDGNNLPIGSVGVGDHDIEFTIDRSKPVHTIIPVSLIVTFS
ncbi:hypothetical protein FFT88_23825 [Escherichia sp. E4930]|uniref:hypothetical protein n=1 Tax=Escherichia sp. E4930 TaxID=2044468 RepID=UPI00107F9EA7|nr:hypothetical protein [Escherichia sp. E4930]TGB71786.1 hypothetical protein CRG96_02295 [Escherichia sp. E4930]TLU76976.1 hypothetical protein FFT88_23825 [Escherichia sp. E4930]